MLKPDPAFNPTGDKEWFGVLTWVQPWNEVQGNRARMVRILAYSERLCRNSLTIMRTVRNLVAVHKEASTKSMLEWEGHQ